MRPGQRLLSISDPMSANGMWDLNDRPSIRFVRDALAMRSADTITLVVSRESVYAPGGGAAQTQMSIDEIDTGASLRQRILSRQQDARTRWGSCRRAGCCPSCHEPAHALHQLVVSLL